MHDIDLILTLTGGLLAALFLGYITQRVGLSPIVGYLLAGIVVGPYTPGFEANQGLATQLAEIGVILLMFGVGLHFHLDELLAVRRIAIPGALGQVAVATLLGAVVGVIVGWTLSAGIVFGLAVSVASTVVLVRVLTDQRDLHTPTGHIAVGWLVVEDIFTVIVLVLLPSLFGEAKSSSFGIPAAIGLTFVKIAALVAVVYWGGGRVVPRLLELIAATKSRELFTLAVLVLALGIAVGSAAIFGVSMALGAFLAGMVVGRSEFSLRAATDALPMRDAFAVLFFVSVGMLFDPRFLLEEPLLVALSLLVVIVGKPLAALAICAFLGRPLKVALAVAVALAQIGEFSFILASAARTLGIFTESATHALVATSIVSITVNPLLYRLVGPIEARLLRWPKIAAFMRRRTAGHADAPDSGEVQRVDHRRRAVIVGYGPVGRTVARILADNAIKPVVIEMNLETVRRLRGEGVEVCYGDAAHPETLTAAGIATAANLILSASSIPNAAQLIRTARELNPEIRVLARSTYVRELVGLREAGADVVVSGESETAIALTTEILETLGAGPEQIDRERERVRLDLLGPSGD